MTKDDQVADGVTSDAAVARQLDLPLMSVNLVEVPVADRRAVPIGASSALSMAIPGLTALAAGAAPGQNVYQMVASPEIMKGLASGALTLDKVGAGVVRGDVRSALGQYAGKVEFSKVDKSVVSVASAAAGAMQLASFAVGQYHLAQISSRIHAIEEAGVRIEKALTKQGRRILTAAEDVIRSALAVLEDGESIAYLHDRIADARSDVVALFADLVERAEDHALPLAVYAAASRRERLSSELKAITRGRRAIEGEWPAPVEKVEQSVRSRFGQRPAERTWSPRVAVALGELSAIEGELRSAIEGEDIADQMTKATKKTMANPVDIDALLDDLAEVARAAQLIAILTALSVESAPTGAHGEAEARAGRHRIQESVVDVLSTLPEHIATDLASLPATGEDSVDVRWTAVGASAASLRAIAEVLAATADDSLTLMRGDESGSLVFARLTSPEVVGS